jgi:hypothetical protein
MTDTRKNSALRFQRALSTVLGLIAIVAVVFAVVEHNAASSSSVTPKAITGKWMGTNTDGTAFAFQSNGSSTGSSYALSSDIHWWSANGSRALSGVHACLKADGSSRIITIGVVTVKPVRVPLGDVIVTYVKC